MREKSCNISLFAWVWWKVTRMSTCKYLREAERWFDSGMPGDAGAAGHVKSCAVCAAHVERLGTLQRGARQAAVREGVGEGQFPAFMAGIHEGLERRPAWAWRRVWAPVSAVAAALVIGLSSLAVLSGDPGAAEGTVVESWSTELEDAEVSYYSTENGTTTVWVSVAQEDMW